MIHISFHFPSVFLSCPPHSSLIEWFRPPDVWWILLRDVVILDLIGWCCIFQACIVVVSFLFIYSYHKFLAVIPKWFLVTLPLHVSTVTKYSFLSLLRGKQYSLFLFTRLLSTILSISCFCCLWTVAPDFLLSIGWDVYSDLFVFIIIGLFNWFKNFAIDLKSFVTILSISMSIGDHLLSL